MKKNNKIFKSVIIGDTKHMSVYNDTLDNYLKKKFDDVESWSQFSKYLIGVVSTEIFGTITNLIKLASKDQTLKQMLDEEINCADLTNQVLDLIKLKLFPNNIAQ